MLQRPPRCSIPDVPKLRQDSGSSLQNCSCDFRASSFPVDSRTLLLPGSSAGLQSRRVEFSSSFTPRASGASSSLQDAPLLFGGHWPGGLPTLEISPLLWQTPVLGSSPSARRKYQLRPSTRLHESPPQLARRDFGPDRRSQVTNQTAANIQHCSLLTRAMQ